jgi:tetratricopeptide (TPR) repeat protein
VGRVSGVVKGEDGQPLKGATITADNSNFGQTFTSTTDDKGRFQVLGLRTGTWRFIAQAPGFALDAGSMNVRMGAPNPPITFVLKRSGVAAYGLLGGITARELQGDLAAGDAHYAQGRWDEAVAMYRRVLDKSSALAIVNLQIAAAYRGKKDYAAALDAYDALLKADPENAKAHVGIAMINIDRGDQAAAEAHLLKAAEREGAGREVFYSLGDIRMAASDPAGAARWYQKAAESDPFWGKPVYQLGVAAMKRGNAEEAIQMMTRVVAIDPASPEATSAKATLESLKK